MGRTKLPVKQALRKLPHTVKAGGKIKKIIALYKKGYPRTDIIEAGFNRNTVYRQTRDYETGSGLFAR